MDRLSFSNNVYGPFKGDFSGLCISKAVYHFIHRGFRSVNLTELQCLTVTLEQYTQAMGPSLLKQCNFNAINNYMHTYSQVRVSKYFSKLNLVFNKTAINHRGDLSHCILRI